MPFTLAHPAAVLPVRRYLPFSALIIGSLSPDFEYLLRLAGVSRFSHTLSGVFYFCAPVGLLVLWLFHRFIKRPSWLLLPIFVRRRIVPAQHFKFWPPGRLLLLIIALIVGALTHVVWDSLTHEYGWVVERYPTLQASVYTIAGHDLKLYKLFQYGSSAFGLLILLIFFVRWLLKQPVQEQADAMRLPEQVRHRIVSGIVLSTLIAGIGLGLWSAVANAGLNAVQVFVVQSLIGGMLSFAACLLLYSFVWQAISSKTKQISS